MSVYKFMMFRGKRVLVTRNVLNVRDIPLIDELKLTAYGMNTCILNYKPSCTISKDCTNSNWGHMITPSTLLKDDEITIVIKKAEHKLISTALEKGKTIVFSETNIKEIRRILFPMMKPQQKIQENICE